MWNYSKKIRLAFFSLVIGLFLIPILQSSFSQTNGVEEPNDSSIEKLLEIKGDPVTNGTINYQVVVSGQITKGPKANPGDKLSPDGTTIDGKILPTGKDNYYFTGNIVSITADQHIFSFIDGEPFKVPSEEDLRLIEEYLDQAKTLFEQRYTESTIFHYEKVLAIDSLNIDALNGKAFVLDFVGSSQEAISYYDQVLLIDSKNNDALLGKALALDNLGKSEEALFYLNRALGTEETPQPIQDITDDDLEFLEISFELAQELFEGGHYEEAISYYGLVLQIIPSDIDALTGKAIALDTIGNHEEAILFYDMALAIDSTDIDALNGKAVSLESLGNDEESFSNLEKIETLIPPEVEFSVPPEGTVNQAGVEEIAEYDQILFIIIGVFIIILVSIILVDFIVRRKKYLKTV